MVPMLQDSTQLVFILLPTWKYSSLQYTALQTRVGPTTLGREVAHTSHGLHIVLNGTFFHEAQLCVFLQH